VLKREYAGQNCSIARALEVIGDRWTLLVIRDVALGRRRFDKLLDGLGIASNVLADRLSRLVDEGILEREQYRERPARYEYRLTAKGRELGVPLLALMQWGDRHLSPKPPRLARRRGDRAPVSVELVAPDGSLVAPGDLELVPGPGSEVRPSPHRAEEMTTANGVTSATMSAGDHPAPVAPR
jgi:DNA-binding HxlR family transcriptional regulator